MEGEDPEPVSEVGRRLSKDIGLSSRLIWTIIIGQGVLLVTLAVISSLLGIAQLNEHSRVDGDVIHVVSSQCQFYESLASAQLSAKTNSRIAVQLVEGSRRSVHGLGCPGKLPPPSPALLELGRKWGVPITY